MFNMTALLKRPVLEFNLQLSVRESWKIETDNQKCFYYLYLLIDDGFVS